MVIQIEKDFGDAMGLIRIASNKAILILIQRIENSGPWVYLNNDIHPYPIIRFEQPPELCGVDEPRDPAAYTKLRTQLHKEFIDALIQACNNNDIHIIYCADTDDPRAILYKEALQKENIQIENCRDAKIEIAGIAIKV